MMRRVIRCALVLAVTALLCGPLAAGEDGKGQSAADKEKAMMEAWMKHATPGDGHKKLQPLVGQFTYTGKIWMDPSKPPTEIKGGCERKWILDGRFIDEHFTGEFMGMPFHGLGRFGYDNTKKQYVSTWVDNMTTSIALSTGGSDEAGKVLTMTHEDIDPTDGKTYKARDVTRIVSDDKHEIEMFKTGPDGKEIKVMEFTLTRTGK
jgi:hypothetical protein